MHEHEHAWHFIWPCDCWFCRHISRPLLSRLFKKEFPVLNELLKERERKIAKVREVSAPTTPGLDELRNEITEIKKSIMDLKKALAEIKAVMADMSSPYTVLTIPQQSETSGKRVKVSAKIKSEKPSEPIVSESIMAGKSNSMEKGGEKVSHELPITYEEYGKEIGKQQRAISKKTETMSLEDMKHLIRELGSALAVKESEEKQIEKINIKKVIRILRTIYSLRKTLPKESIENIVKLAEILGLITKREKEILTIIVSLVEDGLKQNMTLEDQIIILYILMKNLGYTDEELEEELLKIVSDIIITRKKTGKKTAQEDEGGRLESLQQLIEKSS